MNSLIDAPLDISEVLFYAAVTLVPVASTLHNFTRSIVIYKPSYRASSTFSLDDEASALAYHLHRVVMSFETLSIIRTNTPNGSRT